MSWIRQTFLYSSVFLFIVVPTWANASCQSTVNEIYDDITKYGDNLKDQRLPWMQLSWLQAHLGASENETVNPNQIRYQWTCDNNGNTFSADTDAEGNLLSVKGEYDSDTGSSMFSAQITQSSSEKEFNQLITKINTTPPDNLLPAPQSSNQQEKKCDEVIGKIHTDIASYPTTVKTVQFLWKNLSWLQQELGKGESTVTYDNAYTWNNYSLFIGVDGTTAEMGTPPNGTHVKTAADALNAFGRPKKTTTEPLNQVSWQCAVNTNNTSSLTVLSQKDNELIAVMGRDCSDDACTSFFSTLSESTLAHKFKQQIQEQEQVKVEALAAKLRDYNEYFKTSFETQEQLETDAAAKVKLYYANLRKCTPGVYQYAVPVLQEYLFNTASIKKQEEGLCHVETAYNIPKIGKVVLKCKYQPQSLALFTDQEAESYARGMSNFDSENPSELQKAMNNDCTRYIDGVP